MTTGRVAPGPTAPGPTAPGPVAPGQAAAAPTDAVPAAAATPTAVPSALPSLDRRGAGTRPAVDPAVARELKRQVAAELHQQITRLTSGSGTEPDRATRRQRGRALIEEAVARWSDTYAQTHGIPPTREQDRALAEAVFDLLFRAGRLQPYLDDPDIENILVNGCDDVWVSRVHQPLRQVPPVADSDAELVELLQ
ncbi:ATP/GTP-binding protein, partial [Streptomyces sp. NRRL S-495]